MMGNEAEKAGRFILNDLCEDSDFQCGEIGDWKLLILFSYFLLAFFWLFVCSEGKE